jgi:hypothetical protein
MQKCPSCPRAGADIGSCGHIAMCPGTSVPVEPGKDVILHCEPCEKTRVVSVVDLIHGRRKGLDLQCPRGDNCACRAVDVTPRGLSIEEEQRISTGELRPTPPFEVTPKVAPGRKGGGKATPRKL